MENIRWNLAVTKEVDQSLHVYLAEQGGGRKGDLSKFVEEAVRASLFERSVAANKMATAHLSESELTTLIDDAVDWARKK